MQPASICILGGSGFLGTRLVARLIKDGHRVTVLSRDREQHKHLLVLPGLIAKVLYPDLKSADQAYPTLLGKLMPTGLLGLAIAGIAAALMGHISATYNSVATLFTRDFYLRFRPEASQERQILVGRIAVVCVFILGAAWAPMIGKFGNLFTYLQTVQAYLMMPFAGIFFAGVLWKRTTATGVVACLVTACIVCPLLMLNGQLAIRHKDFLPFMRHPLLQPWLHAAMVSFSVCMVVLVAVSLLTRPPAPERLQGTTVTSVGSLLRTDVAVPLLRDYRLWLGVIVAVTSLLWFWMR